MIDFIPEQEYQTLLSGHALASPASAGSRHATRDNGQIINVGREHVCVLSFEDGLSSGHDSFLMLGDAAAGSGIAMPESGKGVVSLRAAQDGLLRVNDQALRFIHGIDAVNCQTLPNNEVVLKSQIVARLHRISPKFNNDSLQQVESICHQHRPIIDVLPFKQFRVGIVTAGINAPDNWKNDTITPLLCEKFKEFGSSVLRLEYVAADIAATLAALHKSILYGADMITLVNNFEPEQYTALLSSLKSHHGTQNSRVYSGKLFSCSWFGPIPVLRFDASAQQGCIESIIDQVIPRFLAGTDITQEEVDADGDQVHLPRQS
ncbi:MAG: molybdopterin binding domain-containing [Desulfobulbaceae bacterium]|nr:MAG: molybdopterin binding domain-containing [Desulfobulbaceae bacterium]